MLQQQHSLQQPLHHPQQQQLRQGSLHLDGLHGHQLLGHAGPGSVGGSSMRDRGERDSTLLQLMAEGSSLSQAALHMPGLGLQASVGSQLWHESSGAVGQGVAGQLLPPLVSKASSMGHLHLGRRISHMGQQVRSGEVARGGGESCQALHCCNHWLLAARRPQTGTTSSSSPCSCRSSGHWAALAAAA